jgi:hypothetical protein
MLRALALMTALAAAGAPALAAEELFFKSPGPGMRFTAGLPIIVWADALPRDEQPGFPVVEGFWDAQPFATAVNVVGAFNYFPLTVPGTVATPGTHVLKLRATFRSGAIREASMPVSVDPWPPNLATPCTAPSGQQFCTVELGANAAFTNLDWTHVAVRGNGHTVTVSGSLTIRDSLVTGLGSLTGLASPQTAVMVKGITGTLTGNVDVRGSTFEATGALDLVLNGSGTVALRDNEFRASNFIRFVPSDPDASPVLRFRGSHAPQKLFQGNRIASGRVVFEGMANWLVGAGVDQNEADGNILMGPRCTIEALDSDATVIRGNYDRHNYRGEWSQGFNLVLSGSAQDTLVEHNLIRGGSWPVQTLAGEFRYNLVVGYGHEWIRTLHTGARIHHNVLVPEGGGGLNAGIWAYLPSWLPSATGQQVYNNTLDGGALTGDFAGPFVEISDPLIQVTSLRNNLFTYARDYDNGSPGEPLVRGANGSYLYADYNAFYSPDSSQPENYDAIVPGHNEGEPGFAGHDVSGTGATGVLNGRLAAHPFAGVRDDPYSVDEAAVWNRQLGMGQVLAGFRDRYRPAAGSPIVDAGDVADNDSQGRRTDIGAIDLAGHDLDRFGRYGTAVTPALTIDDVTVPEGSGGTTPAVFTVRLSAPSAQAVAVSYATADGTAIAPGDYTAASGPLTFAAGTTARTLVVSVTGDALVEPDETFSVQLANPSGATVADGQGVATISDDDAPPLDGLELGHGTALAKDLDAGRDDFRMAQSPRASYEVLVDAASGDMAPVLQRLAADQSTILQASEPVGTGTSQSLRWQNTSASAVLNQPIRVRSSRCSSDCGPGDAYRIRSWDTTYPVPRFNNGGSQLTVLVLQNATARAVSGRAYFWSTGGALLASHAFALDPRATLTLNTSTVPGLAGQAGSATIAHDGGYGALAGKAVALEPATGYSFDSLLAPRPR